MNASVCWARLLLGASFIGCSAAALGMVSGPADRVVTPPQSVVSKPQEGVKPVSVVDILQTTSMGGVALSPDATHIAYVGNASGRLNLWVMNADGSAQRQLLHSNDRQAGAVFTPDGRDVVYMQDNGGDEMYDLWAVPVAGGTPRDLTHTEHTSEIGPEFSRDGTLLAFGSKEKTSPYTNIAVMAWPGGTTRLLTHETDPTASWRLARWSPDGRAIYAVRSINQDNSDIYRIDVKSGAAENLTAHPGKELIEVSDVSPDGKTLLGSSNRNGGFANVGLFDVRTRQWKWVTNTQWQALPAAFAPNGKSFTYLLNVDGRAAIQFVNLATLQAKTNGLPVGLNFPAGNPEPYAANGSLYFAHQDSSHPMNLFVMRPDGAVQQISHNESPALVGAVLPQSQLVTYKSFDGRLISAYLWVPCNLKRDGAAAAVVLPHGGPTGQVVDSFNAQAMLLASRGFLVIAPNVRGSTGYGMDFQKANYKDLGGSDLKDELAGVDFLKATGYVDAKRIGIWGGSYGGFMTLMAIGKAPDVWAAGVDEYGILNWLTMLQHEDPSLQAYEKSLLGDPQKDLASYEASSPLKYIRNERAPLLVLQGERDIRVPIEEAQQVVAILKAEGRTVDAVYYPEEGHGFMKREHQIDELTRSVDWLQKYLQGSAH